MNRATVIVLFIFIHQFACAKSPIVFSKAPSWVSEFDQKHIITTNEASSYLLVEKHYYIEKKHFFKRTIAQINQFEGIDNHSEVSVSWDPQYEKIIFHKAQIIRDNIIIEELGSNDFQVLQAEKTFKKKQ